ncbi:hypothetical protein BaRGS_00037981 [Batillaria attramentaria]|uniref:Uncharacterized protein n=1 Tax=Batillaria attramentaria TaxID=370345 RepID=A0ABD0J792_9CAEN
MRKRQDEELRELLFATGVEMCDCDLDSEKSVSDGDRERTDVKCCSYLKRQWLLAESGRRFARNPKSVGGEGKKCVPYRENKPPKKRSRFHLLLHGILFPPSHISSCVQTVAVSGLLLG